MPNYHGKWRGKFISETEVSVYTQKTSRGGRAGKRGCPAQSFWTQKISHRCACEISRTSCDIAVMCRDFATSPAIHTSARRTHATRARARTAAAHARKGAHVPARPRTCARARAGAALALARTHAQRCAHARARGAVVAVVWRITGTGPCWAPRRWPVRAARGSRSRAPWRGSAGRVACGPRSAQRTPAPAR